MSQPPCKISTQALLLHGHAKVEHNRQLTPMIFCKSEFEYVLMTFTATSRQRCFPFHTSANPPLYNGPPVRSYEVGTLKVVGRSALWPHVLYSDLRKFFRVRGERSGLSSAWADKVRMSVSISVGLQ